jgi:hypothetical protein
MTGILLCDFPLCFLKWTKSTSLLSRPNFIGKKPKHFASYCQQEEPVVDCMKYVYFWFRRAVTWSDKVWHGGRKKNKRKLGHEVRCPDRNPNRATSKYKSKAFQVQPDCMEHCAYIHTRTTSPLLSSAPAQFTWPELCVCTSNKQNAAVKKQS